VVILLRGLFMVIFILFVYIKCDLVDLFAGCIALSIFRLDLMLYGDGWVRSCREGGFAPEPGVYNVKSGKYFHCSQVRVSSSFHGLFQALI